MYAIRSYYGSSRVVVVGAGFIGMEVAASCRVKGLEVVLGKADRRLALEFRRVPPLEEP